MTFLESDSYFRIYGLFRNAVCVWFWFVGFCFFFFFLLKDYTEKLGVELIYQLLDKLLLSEIKHTHVMQDHSQTLEVQHLLFCKSLQIA